MEDTRNMILNYWHRLSQLEFPIPISNFAHRIQLRHPCFFDKSDGLFHYGHLTFDSGNTQNKIIQILSTYIRETDIKFIPAQQTIPYYRSIGETGTIELLPAVIHLFETPIKHFPEITDFCLPRSLDLLKIWSEVKTFGQLLDAIDEIRGDDSESNRGIFSIETETGGRKFLVGSPDEIWSDQYQNAINDMVYVHEHYFNSQQVKWFVDFEYKYETEVGGENTSEGQLVQHQRRVDEGLQLVRYFIQCCVDFFVDGQLLFDQGGQQITPDDFRVFLSDHPGSHFSAHIILPSKTMQVQNIEFILNEILGNYDRENRLKRNGQSVIDMVYSRASKSLRCPFSTKRSEHCPFYYWDIGKNETTRAPNVELWKDALVTCIGNKISPVDWDSLYPRQEDVAEQIPVYVENARDTVSHFIGKRKLLLAYLQHVPSCLQERVEKWCESNFVWPRQVMNWFNPETLRNRIKIKRPSIRSINTRSYPRISISTNIRHCFLSNFQQHKHATTYFRLNAKTGEVWVACSHSIHRAMRKIIN